ncbi:hypothetical protein BOX37_16320 [Nocardia mangyaensis]|uniref:UvrABC system protein A n=1 Tax=Nocardia mangyaensis TaxID=2213200 RepID=A0A1J0VTB4_9NOCA|nr:hypothetical protein BOX37_16320 [Nocardia mangyaensis]
MDSHEVDPSVRVRGARVHNLRDVDADMPRNALVAFTGGPGSGKSSLAFGTLYAEAPRRYLESVAPYARRLLHQVEAREGDYPEGPARTGAGHYPEGTNRLYSDAFSPNTVEGACPRCHGQGVVHEATEASMVPDPSRSIRDGAIASWPRAWQDKNLRDVLAALGYDIDRPYQGTYAGAERLLLRSHAESKSETTRRALRASTVYLLDEPTTGLHPADTDVLLRQLDSLVDPGASVVVVEHDMTVVARADHVIDMGPGGGAQGGRIVAQGTPEQVGADPDSRTAPDLAERIA